MIRQFWTRKESVTYGIVGETRKKEKTRGYVRPESARNISRQDYSYECSLKQHKNCPKKHHSTCQCLCHKAEAHLNTEP